MSLPSRVSRRTVLGAAAALAACRRPSGAAANLSTVTLRVGTYKGGVQHALKAAGLDDTPYKIAWAEFAGGNLLTEAIEARAVDVGSMSEIPPIFVAGRPSLLRLVAVQKADVNAQVVLVPKDSPIRSPAELKGKRVGYVRATTAQYLLIKLLAEHGLTLADVQGVPLSPSDGLSAFGQGSLDAWVIYGVHGSLARARLGARVLATGLGRLSGNYVQAALSEALADPPRRAAVIDHLLRSQKANAWQSTHPEAWAAVQAQVTGAPAEIFLQQYRERSGPTALAPVDEAAIASQQAVADAFAKVGSLPAHVDVRPLWTQELNSALA